MPERAMTNFTNDLKVLRPHLVLLPAFELHLVLFLAQFVDLVRHLPQFYELLFPPHV